MSSSQNRKTERPITPADYVVPFLATLGVLLVLGGGALFGFYQNIYGLLGMGCSLCAGAMLVLSAVYINHLQKSYNELRKENALFKKQNQPG